MRLNADRHTNGFDAFMNKNHKCKQLVKDKRKKKKFQKLSLSKRFNFQIMLRIGECVDVQKLLLISALIILIYLLSLSAF